MKKAPKISEERAIVNRANALAREFYNAYGYEVPEGYCFHEATHPQELSMWHLAVIAFDFIEGTDVADCLSQSEDEES